MLLLSPYKLCRSTEEKKKTTMEMVIDNKNIKNKIEEIF